MQVTQRSGAEALLLPSSFQPLWERAGAIIQEHVATLPAARVAPSVEPEEIRARLSEFDFATAREPGDLISFVSGGMQRWQTHVGHPGYWGLYVPAPTGLGIIGDVLAAAFNPQLANWSHAPFAIELEQHVLKAFAGRLGFAPESAGGTFTSGGAEANHSALLVALAKAIPHWHESGLQECARPPRIYLARNGHHSWVKAARACGLGDRSLCWLDVDREGRCSPEHLMARLRAERDTHLPVLVVATAGTTSEGVVDPLSAIAAIARAHDVWFHVDAAWAGALITSDANRRLISGIEEADSVTCDAHKWLSVPMGAGMFVTQHQHTLPATFDVSTGYMPKSNGQSRVVDPYRESMQWSRRFIGLKVFLSLASVGWEGYGAAIDEQLDLGRRLRASLIDAGWTVVNATELPVVCITDGQGEHSADPVYLEAIVREVLRDGDAWVSLVQLEHRGAAIRCCVSNMRSGEADITTLIRSLNRARRTALVAADR